MTAADDERNVAEEILRNFRRVAVVGISDNPDRPSFGVASYLRAAGFEIVPVNPNLSVWEGLPCYASLRDIPAPIEVVDIFRRSELVEPVVDEAIAIGARAVWMQDGVVNPAAAAKARAAGLMVVMDRCMLRDHRAMRARDA
jgi:predicted CoA-binding protein